MVKATVRESEKGQAVVLVVASMSVFLFGALGMAIDGSQLFAQRQMAQMAADAAAQAGIVTIFNGSSAIGTTSYYCTSANTTSPCTYAQKNNFTPGGTACTSGSDATPGNDCVKVDPNPGVSITGLDPGTPNELQVTITRAVPMTVLKMVGLNSFKVTARATAAILDIMAPVPIIVTQPWQPSSFDVNSGNVSITITGGPQRSIQVNSSDSSSLYSPFHPQIDLSGAGPHGTGGDFGDFGGPSGGVALLNPAPSSSNTIHFLQPADPIDDPLAGVSAPSLPALAHTPTPLPNGLYGCPASPSKPCMMYFPGVYSDTHLGSINIQNQTAVFAPGIYYMTANTSGAQGMSLSNGAHGDLIMASGLSDSSTNVTVVTDAGGNILPGGVQSCCGTAQGWDGTQANGGLLFYFTGPTLSTIGSGHSACTPVSPAANVGSISLGANSNVTLIGSPTSGSYKGILFFVDRTAVSQTQTFGGGTSAITLYGTIYATDSISQMGATSSATCSQNELVYLTGTSGSTTTITGEIITSTLKLDGGGSITMTLSPLALTTVRQIALVSGE